MVDTVYINLRKNSIDKNQLMILDMLANFDWKRPIYMTQVYILQDFGLMDYLQFDGYAYRFVPILTPMQNPWEIGRVDADYAAPLLRDTFRYGNLSDPRVYADYFIQYNLSASHARDSFARVAKELLRQDRAQEAVELLDDFLTELRARGVPVLLISGNHDSPERLAFGGRVMDSCGIHISPVYDGALAPVTLQDAFGPVHVLSLINKLASRQRGI